MKLVWCNKFTRKNLILQPSCIAWRSALSHQLVCKVSMLWTFWWQTLLGYSITLLSHLLNEHTMWCMHTTWCHAIHNLFGKILFWLIRSKKKFGFSITFFSPPTRCFMQSLVYDPNSQTWGIWRRGYFCHRNNLIRLALVEIYWTIYTGIHCRLPMQLGQDVHNCVGG